MSLALLALQEGIQQAHGVFCLVPTNDVQILTPKYMTYSGILMASFCNIIQSLIQNQTAVEATNLHQDPYQR